MKRGRKADPQTEQLKVQAKALYEEGWKLAEIARQYGIKPGTLRRWKYEGKWTEKNSERSELNSERSEKEIQKKTKTIEQDIEAVGSSDLNDQQLLFCLFSMLEFMLAYLLPLCLP